MLRVILQIATWLKNMLSTIGRRMLEAELRRAVALHSPVYVRALVEFVGVSVDGADERGHRPMHYALVQGGNVEKARFLLDNGANVDALDRSGLSYLVNTVVQDHVELTQLLLEYGADTELRGQTCTPLGIAIIQGSGRMVTLLLRHGASTEKVLVDDESPSALTRTSGALHLACESGQIEIVQLMLDYGLDINCQNSVLKRSGQDPERLSPLCVACLVGNFDVARLLLQKGARVLFGGDLTGWSSPPLIQALRNGSFPLIQLLVEHIARVGDSDDGESSSSRVVGDCLGGNTLLCAVLEADYKAARLFLDYHANVNKGPILVRCVQGGSVDGALFLLDAGADVNRADRHGETPLLAAAHAGHVALVKEFLQSGANVNSRHEVSHETPLGAAYRQGHLDIVYLLLRTSPHVWSRLRKVW